MVTRSLLFFLRLATSLLALGFFAVMGYCNTASPAASTHHLDLLLLRMPPKNSSEASHVEMLYGMA